MTTSCYDYNHPLPTDLREAVADFLFRQLGRFGDPLDDILKAIDYSMLGDRFAGGFVCVAADEREIIGASVVNRTGMASYIPENILVYIAVDARKRGLGFGRQLMETVLAKAEGNIALHVEADNPACGLYKKLGFTGKYLEMRLCRKGVS